MTINRRMLMATGAGLGLAGLAAGQADAGPRTSGSPSTAGGYVELAHNTEHPQTAAIQAAIDAAAVSGAPVLFPPGRFVCGRLLLHKGTKLIGAHGATTLVATETGPFISGSIASDIVVSDLAIDGRYLASHLIQLEGCSGGVSNCTLQGARETAIFCNDSTRLRIAHNDVSQCGNNGIQVWRSEIGRDGAQIVANRVYGIRADAGGSGENGNGINVFRAGDVLVSGNRIEDCVYSAVRGNTASNLQVLGNSCIRLGEVAIYAEFGFEGAVISQNVIDGAATGIAVTNFNEGGRLAVVQGNLVRNLKRRLQEPVDKRGDGITVEADTCVSDNVIEGAEATGLLIGWGVYMRNVVATGNIIRTAGVGIAIASDPTAGACLVANNMISGAKEGAIRGMDHGKFVGGELAHQETRTARVRIVGNLSV